MVLAESNDIAVDWTIEVVDDLVDATAILIIFLTEAVIDWFWSKLTVFTKAMVVESSKLDYCETLTTSDGILEEW